MRVAVASLVLVLVLAGCAGGASGTAAGGGNPNAIGDAQLRELDPEGLTVLQLIERLRPNWLRPRGTTGFGGGGASASIPRAVVDGVPLGDYSDLARISAREVRGIEFFSAGDATTRFGTGYPGGAILVRTR
jgi:hypothetical protein